MIKNFEEFINESSRESDAHSDIKLVGNLMDKYNAEFAFQDKNIFTLTFYQTNPSKSKLEEILAYINKKAKHFDYELQGKVEEFPGEDGETHTKFVQDLIAKA
jgi:succinate dehydrogenase flavin-adding protein (antitoxin of CptAB toxin-antitoxin module)